MRERAIAKPLYLQLGSGAEPLSGFRGNVFKVIKWLIVALKTILSAYEARPVYDQPVIPG